MNRDFAGTPILPILGTSLWLVMPPDAHARFLESDADRIDPEERLGTETFIDRESYRFPLIYDELWDDNDTGFRISAGSFTAKRFDYTEDIKLQTSLSAPAGLSYRQNRREDMLEQRRENEVRAWAKPGAGLLRASLLGDGGTYKEYGDMGGALAYWQDRRHWIEITYWSVDHFYEEKKSDEADSRPRQTATYILSGDWTRGLWRWQGGISIDTPLTWKRPSRGYTYDYKMSAMSYRIAYAKASDASIVMSGEEETKYEAKTWPAAEPTTYYKSMQRTEGVHCLALVTKEQKKYDELGVTFIARDVNYRFVAPPGVDPADAPERASPAFSKRREVGVHATRYEPLNWPNLALQYGLFLDRVDLREGTSHWLQPEAKVQVGWDYTMSEKAHAFLNTTWDPDKLARNYPYNRADRPFRPWGGGELALIAVF